MARLEFQGKHLDFLNDTTPEIDLEGALSSGKTIVALWKELEALRQYRGINILIARWTADATDTLLRPQFEKVARMHGTPVEWDDKQKLYRTPNGGVVFAFGLKTQSTDPEQRYGKIRGLPVSRIYIDQAEQLPGDIASELRARLRPDIEGKSYPRQLTFTPNPTDKNHWLAKQFPENNQHLPLRKYYSLSLYDNQHNLPPEMIQTMLLEFPPEHPKHKMVILGERGQNISGDRVYESYIPTIHLAKMDVNPLVPLLEVIDAGKRHPAVLWSQFDQWGRWIWLGGLMAQNIGLGEFCDILAARRQQWFGVPTELYQACNPFGMRATTDTAVTVIEVLRQHGILPRYMLNANQPIIRRGAIERTSDYMRKRTAKGEAFVVDPDRWLVITPSEVREEAFGPEALYAGYVWAADARRSANKQIQVPKEDDWYEHIMACAELTELHFGRGQQSEAKIARKAEQMEAKRLRESQLDPAEKFRWNRQRSARRAGY